MWQGPFVALVMYLWLRRHKGKPAYYRYNIGVAAMLLLFVLSLFTFSFYLLKNTGGGSHEEQAILILAAPEAAISSPVEALTESTWISLLQEHAHRISFTWIIGVLVFSMRIILGGFYLSNLKRKLSFQVPPAFTEVMGKVAARLKIDRKVRIALTSSVKIPMMIGHLKPIVILPVAAVNQLSIEEVESIITHELAHILRNDYIQNLIFIAVESFFFYHPVIWWMSSVIREERENCCDDLTIQLTSDRITYARSLVKLEEIHQSRAPHLALTLFKQKKNLMNRIKRILNQKQTSSHISEKAGATFFLLLFMLTFTSAHNFDLTKKEAMRGLETLPPLATQSLTRMAPINSAVRKITPTAIGKNQKYDISEKNPNTPAIKDPQASEPPRNQFEYRIAPADIVSLTVGNHDHVTHIAARSKKWNTILALNDKTPFVVKIDTSGQGDSDEARQVRERVREEREAYRVKMRKLRNEIKMDQRKLSEEERKIIRERHRKVREEARKMRDQMRAKGYDRAWVENWQKEWEENSDEWTAQWEAYWEENGKKWEEKWETYWEENGDKWKDHAEEWTNHWELYWKENSSKWEEKWKSYWEENGDKWQKLQERELDNKDGNSNAILGEEWAEELSALALELSDSHTRHIVPDMAMEFASLGNDMALAVADISKNLDIDELTVLATDMAEMALISSDLWYFDDYLETSLVNELRADGLLDEEGPVSIVISNSSMEVNGKSLSAEMLEKYQDLLQNFSSTAFTKDTQITIVISGNSQQERAVDQLDINIH
jgi:beta-lactamase regulating signal transducer with metallopeptidase domain